MSNMWGKKGGRKVVEDPRTAAVEVKNPHSCV
jgi:hypothetical protein